jgi:hypothetical protein
MKKRKKARIILKTKKNLKLLLVGLISLVLICLMLQILNLMVKCSSRRISIFLMTKSLLSKESGLMMYRMESAFLNQKIEEVFKHLHMENQKEDLHGLKINKLELEVLLNTMIMMMLKVLIDSIIVSSNNAMLLVLMNKLLHLDG